MQENSGASETTGGGTGHTELDIIEAGYRLVADAGAFGDMATAWIRRIEQVDRKQVETLTDPLIVTHLEAASTMFDQVAPQPTRDPAEMALERAAGAGVLLTPGGRIIKANDRAQSEWGLSQKQSAGEDISLSDWIDPASIPAFKSVANSASLSQSRKTRRHAIIRLIRADGDPSLAECIVMEPTADRDALIGIFALDLAWNDSVANVLREAFALSEAELEVCRLLLDTRDTEMIAQQRGTTVLTVRTQLRAIFSKTETATQVDLVRLIAMLCGQASDDEIASMPSEWVDPLGREHSFVGPQGYRIAYSWMGAEDGTPHLFVHGMGTGYLLPRAGQEALAAAGIKLIALQRPGFGSSDPWGKEHPLEAGAQAVGALAEHLGIESWVGVANGAGLPVLARAARLGLGRMERIIAFACYLPFEKLERFDSFPRSRRIALRLSRSSAVMADLLGRFSLRVMQTENSPFLKDHMFSDCPGDLAAARHPETRHILEVARRLMIAHGHRALSGDLQIISYDWTDDLTAVPQHIQLVHGTQDPTVTMDWAEEIADQHGNIDLTAVEGYGELLLLGQSQLVAEWLARGFAKQCAAEPYRAAN